VDYVTDGVLIRLDWTGRAMTGTVLPPTEASSIIAGLNRTELVLPLRTICRSFCLSCSVSLQTLTGCAIPPPREHQPGESFWSQLYVVQ
jgi:hypothetical protein